MCPIMLPLSRRSGGSASRRARVGCGWGACGSSTFLSFGLLVLLLGGLICAFVSAGELCGFEHLHPWW